jgi:hypothetical protein
VRQPLLVLFALVLAAAGFRWWQLGQRHDWLERATLEDLAAAATRDETDVEVFERLGARARKAEQWGRAPRRSSGRRNWPRPGGQLIGWSRCIYEIDGFRTADLS